ncbi:response regulator transcription factor [Streptomyces virginiae]
MTGPALDPRERRVLELSAAGYTYERIAHELDIRRPSVAKLASQLLRSLGARSMPQAVLIACRAGILDGRRQQRHGDHAGFAAHKYRGEEPCDACWEGERAYRAAQRAALKARQKP